MGTAGVCFTVSRDVEQLIRTINARMQGGILFIALSSINAD